MPMEDIISKLKKNNLLGRGGAEFSVALKWEAVKNAKTRSCAKASTGKDKKYVVCNGSEGEPGVFKDGFILEHYPKEVIGGIAAAIEAVGAEEAYIYLNKNYYKKFVAKLRKVAGSLPITVFEESGGYLAGEETVLLNCIEGKFLEPRQKPPFPTQSGLFSRPTLINNVETFYHVFMIKKDAYKNTRFYSISGDVKKKGVFELPTDYSVSQILKETSNWPDFEFFVQVGGGASGEILLHEELNRRACGAGAIVVYNKNKTNLTGLMKKWAEFFMRENCDKCTPCREGIFRIAKMLETGKIDAQLMKDMIFVLKETSFCALGKSAAVPFESLFKKVYKK
jgi:NADH:ubiquinone oxidoreductase subunit F (NADH-binding)